MSYILVMYIYAGVFAKGDSVTMLSVPGFKTVVACKAAGRAGSPLIEGSTKEYRFICLEQ